MIRTVKQSVEYLLRYLSTEEQAIPETVTNGATDYPGRIDAALQAVNGALQEVFALGSLHQARRPFGDLLRAPVTTTFDVVKDSRDLRFSDSSFESWMIGCTCKIAGDGGDNQVLDYDSSTSTLTLRTPYSGDSSGEKSVTIWHDSLEPDSLAGEILSIHLEGYGALIPANSPEGMKPTSGDFDDFGAGETYARSMFVSSERRLTSYVGVPRQYFVDTLHRSNRAPERRIRVFPLPEKQIPVTYRARALPPQFTKNAVHLEIPDQLTSESYTFDWDGSEYDPDTDDNRFYIEGNYWVRGTAAAGPPAITRERGPFVWEGPIGTYTSISGAFTTVEASEVPDTSTTILATVPQAPLPIHNDWIESIFLPIAAQRFQVSPFFRNDSATAEIARQYEAALQILKTTAPQTKKGQMITPIYG